MKLNTICVAFSICLLIGCQKSEKKTSKSKFEIFSEQFELVKLPIRIDSVFLQKLRDKEINLNQIKISEMNFVQIDELTKLNKDRPTFIISRFGRFELESDHIALIYVANLNPEIPFDAFIDKAVLAIYNRYGMLNSYKEIGLFESHFGHNKMIYGEISSDKNINLTKLNIKKNISEGTVETTTENLNFVINKNGMVHEVN